MIYIHKQSVSIGYSKKMKTKTTLLNRRQTKCKISILLDFLQSIVGDIIRIAYSLGILLKRINLAVKYSKIETIMKSIHKTNV